MKQGSTHRLAKILMLCLLLFATGISVTRADDQSGVVNGYVLDSHGHPITSATVRVFTYDHSAAVALRTTDAGGFFTFVGLLPGHYAIEAHNSVFQMPFQCPPQLVVLPNSFARVTLRLTKTPRTISHIVSYTCPQGPWGDEGIVF